MMDNGINATGHVKNVAYSINATEICNPKEKMEFVGNLKNNYT